MEVDSSLEERLAQTMIDMKKGHDSINLSTVHQQRDYLIQLIDETKKKIDLIKRENAILKSLEEKTLTISQKIYPFCEIDTHLVSVNHGRCHGIRDTATQTDPTTTEKPNISLKAEKFRIINNLTTREKILQEKLKIVQAKTNVRPHYILIKTSEYNDIVSLVASMSSNTSYQEMEIENDANVPLVLSKIGTNSNYYGAPEESDDEGVQLLLSMKRNAFNCKCGEYLSSINDWSEHQKVCSKSTGKTIGEQCPLCKKTFLTCVALNIHSTKKHNKKKVRTDSVMHCPCGQSFTAKWRQNCVHKLNNHGRHCKAFKDIETQCTICKKGFIDRKSLEYHGLKAHKLAVPVNS